MQNKSLFLQEFTKQLILNSKKISGANQTKKVYLKEAKKNEDNKSQVAEHEKSTEEIEKEEYKKAFLTSPAYEIKDAKPKRYLKSFSERFMEKLKFKKGSDKIRPDKRPTPSQPKIAPTVIKQKRKIWPIKTFQKFKPQFPKQPIKPIEQFHPQFKPEFHPEPMPMDFDLGKLNLLIKDPAITTIECPGPGKFLLVGRMREVNITKISLNENEIKAVIQKFSEKSKVPFIGGNFKAAVGNMIITVLASEYIGTRFIITKYSPKIRFRM